MENLKDQSAILSSEIAEHLSPQEAIDASEAAGNEAATAEQTIVTGKENLTKRRTEVLTALNFFRQMVAARGDCKQFFLDYYNLVCLLLDDKLYFLENKNFLTLIFLFSSKGQFLPYVHKSSRQNLPIF